ncbi:MAG: hypothetical protein ACK4GW_15840 [Pseudorhodobacter sp.]
MTAAFLIPLLALLTLLSVIVFALISKGRIEERRHDPSVPPSSLALDGPVGGVAFLNPRLASAGTRHR